jgi:hypothetical protein
MFTMMTNPCQMQFPVAEENKMMMHSPFFMPPVPQFPVGQQFPIVFIPRFPVQEVKPTEVSRDSFSTEATTCEQSVASNQTEEVLASTLRNRARRQRQRQRRREEKQANLLAEALQNLPQQDDEESVTNDDDESQSPDVTPENKYPHKFGFVHIPSPDVTPVSSRRHTVWM